MLKLWKKYLNNIFQENAQNSSFQVKSDFTHDEKLLKSQKIAISPLSIDIDSQVIVAMGKVAE